MVSAAAVIGMVITLMITLILPFVIAIVYGIRNKGKGVWKALLLGAAGFVLLQLIIRLPILNVLSMFPWFHSFAINFYVLYCLLLALTAALFEVVARFGVAKILQKKINYQQGLAAGFGHGGIEAVILIGMTYINNIIYAIMINTGAMQESYNALINEPGMETAAEQIQAIIKVMVETPAYCFYLSGYERILTVICHTAMSLFVCYFVYKKKDFIGVAVAFAIHFFIDFTLPLINGMATEYMGNLISQETAYLLSYSILTLVTIGAIAIICMIVKRWKKQDAAL